MRDVKKLNIWKAEEKKSENREQFLQMDILDLGLSVRSFNCLRRANCNTVKEVLACIGEDGQGLRRIRNLGIRSEKEILEKIEEMRALYEEQDSRSQPKKVRIIRPAKRIWDREIEEFQLSMFSLNRLKSCGVRKVGDLYEANITAEPGWYAVRELFDKIPSSR